MHPYRLRYRGRSTFAESRASDLEVMAKSLTDVEETSILVFRPVYVPRVAAGKNLSFDGLPIVCGRRMKARYRKATRDGIRLFEQLYGHYKTHPSLNLLMTDLDSVPSTLCAHYIKNPGLVRPELLSRNDLVRDANLQNLLEFLEKFESIVPKESFDAVYDECLEEAQLLLQRSCRTEDDIQTAFDRLIYLFGRKIKNATVRVDIEADCWNGATGVVCKAVEGSEEIDVNAGFAGKTDMYIAFGCPCYNRAAFFVAEGKFATSNGMPLPWHQYSQALAAQIWGSFFGHDAWVAMPFNRDGLKIIYRVRLESGRYELRQFPAGHQLLDYKDAVNFPIVTKIFMEIARIGLRTVDVNVHEPVVRIVSVGQPGAMHELTKSRRSSQETIAYNDTEIHVEGRDGNIFKFTSLDLKGRLGEDGIRQLQAEFDRKREEQELEEWKANC